MRIHADAVGLGAGPDRLERYLDGELSGAELSAFEQEVAAETALQQEIDAQQQVDAALRRHFAPPDAPPSMLSIPSEPGATARLASGRSSPRRTWMWGSAAAAAALLLAAGGIWRLMNPPTATWPTQPPVRAERSPPGEAMEQLYAQHVAAGLTPVWVCGSDEEMIKYTVEKFGRPLVVQPSSDVQLIGWAPSKVLSAYTGVLLARVSGEPVLVLVDLADDVDEHEATVPHDSDLRLFERQLGAFKLYELTPRRDAAIIGLFAEPAS